MGRPGLDRQVVEEFRDVATTVMDANLERNAGFERRAVALLSTVAALLTILLALFAATDISHLPASVRVLVSVGLVCLLLSAACLVMALRPLVAQVSTRIRKLWTEYRDDPERVVKMGAQYVQDLVLADATDSPPKPSVLESTAGDASTRGRWLGLAVWAMLAGLIGIGSAGLASLW